MRPKLIRRPGDWLLAGAAVLALAGGVPCAEPVKGKKPRHTNRLAREISPYLLMHAHNPVDWYPWGAEAFAKAKKEKKLVFLSIGYSSCYWCHVMERESFANEEVARILNRDYVCIKVDREERPDVDSVYMTALNVTGERGGWPLSMFLTADARPIFGFTYRPPDDKEVNGKRVFAGFKTILNFVTKWRKDKPQEVADQAEEVARRTRLALSRADLGRALVTLDRALVTSALDEIKEEFDPVFGGFGSAEKKFRGTKFPTPPYLSLLLHEAVREKSAELRRMVTLTLDRMARGGIWDHLGGGFHRYSTERTWTVPHFEKMLYDNAQLAEVYSRAYRHTRNPLYKRVVEETLAFVQREMTAPEGGFYSALDAETGGEEGRFYVWTDGEINDALRDKKGAALVRKVYGAVDGYNFESKYHILVLSRPLAESAKELNLTEAQLDARLAPLRQKLFAARSKRPRPFLDRKVLTAWNGQMIAGFATAGKALAEPKYVAAAARAADFVLKHLRTREGRLLRTYAGRPDQAPEARLNGYLDDYAFLVHGLLCLHDATGRQKWLDEARTLTDTMVRYHADRRPAGLFRQPRQHGGFFYTSNDHEKLFARSKDQYDGAQPSGNSVAVCNLVRLWTRTGEKRYRVLAEKTMKGFAGSLKLHPSSLATMAEGLSMYLDARK
jgi:uncharacterized protein YyaL (SSP411 family)